MKEYLRHTGVEQDPRVEHPSLMQFIHQDCSRTGHPVRTERGKGVASPNCRTTRTDLTEKTDGQLRNRQL